LTIWSSWCLLLLFHRGRCFSCSGKCLTQRHCLLNHQVLCPSKDHYMIYRLTSVLNQHSQSKQAQGWQNSVQPYHLYRAWGVRGFIDILHRTRFRVSANDFREVIATKLIWYKINLIKPKRKSYDK
jgi:hypothetical protein